MPDYDPSKSTEIEQVSDSHKRVGRFTEDGKVELSNIHRFDNVDQLIVDLAVLEKARLNKGGSIDHRVESAEMMKIDKSLNILSLARLNLVQTDCKCLLTIYLNNQGWNSKEI